MKAGIFAAIGVGCGLLCGCTTAPPANAPLSAFARDHIASTEIVTAVKQSEVYVFVPQSDLSRRDGYAVGAGGMLLLGLVDTGIDATRQHRVEAASAGLRDAADYHFDDRLRDELQNALTKISWLNVRAARVIKDDRPSSLDAAINGSNSAAVLIVDSDYHLTDDGRLLAVTLDVGLYARATELSAYRSSKKDDAVKSAPTNALYHNSFTENVSVAGDGDTREVNLPIWAANHGANLRQALDESVTALAQRLASDLGGIPTAAGTDAPVGAH